jgi:hypothetical protein
VSGPGGQNQAVTPHDFNCPSLGSPDQQGRIALANPQGLMSPAMIVLVVENAVSPDACPFVQGEHLQAPLERKLAAILAADVEGYSRLMNSDEEQTLATLTSHRTIVDALIENAHGQIFGTAGGSVLAEFPSIVHAFNSAVAIQQAMWRANRELSDDHLLSFSRVCSIFSFRIVPANSVYGFSRKHLFYV